MTADTLTLAEFLLARIAEDETLCRNTMGVPDWWPDRVLRECAAKRVIVEYAAECEAEWEKPGGMGAPYATAESVATEHVLSLLARTYAEHPDYRDEWTR